MEPVLCIQCGNPVERARECYGAPTCYKCLPPPTPLPVIPPKPRWADCDCIRWAYDPFSQGLRNSGHHPNCPKGHPFNCSCLGCQIREEPSKFWQPVGDGGGPVGGES